MENEIKVNDFVRLQNGVMGTVIEIKTVSTNMRGEHAYAYKLGKTKKYNSCWVEDYAIVKHSPNLKDLIQKDDFVNKCRVYEVEEKEITVYQTVKDSATDYNWISFDEIEEVVTKEMLKSISYKVERS